MGIFSRFKGRSGQPNQLENGQSGHGHPNPENKLSTSRPFFIGRATAGVDVNERTTLQTAAVYACVRVMCDITHSMIWC